MKVSINEVQKDTPFEPFVLSITVESLDEALALRALFGGSGAVADAVKESANYINSLGRDTILNVYTRAFLPVDVALRTQGVLK